MAPPAGLEVPFVHELSVWMYASTHHSLSVRLARPFVGPPFAVVGVAASLAGALGSAFMTVLPDAQVSALVRAQAIVQRYSFAASNMGAYLLNDRELASMQRDLASLVGTADFAGAVASAMWVLQQLSLIHISEPTRPRLI
eukprot:1587431-Amphidinium_carterae.1